MWEGRTRVMRLVWPRSAEPHRSLSINFAAIGPRRMPITTAGTIRLRVQICLVINQRDWTAYVRASPRYQTRLILTDMTPYKIINEPKMLKTMLSSLTSRLGILAALNQTRGRSRLFRQVGYDGLRGSTVIDTGSILSSEIEPLGLFT